MSYKKLRIEGLIDDVVIIRGGRGSVGVFYLPTMKRYARYTNNLALEQLKLKAETLAKGVV